MLKRFLIGLSCCALSPIVVQVQGVLPFLDEAPQLKAKVLEKADSHWAFQPIEKPALPEVKQKSWVKNPIDLFVLHALEKSGCAPAEPADSHALLRRAHFDLLGLPPDPESIEAFVKDPDWPNLVKELLASPITANAMGATGSTWRGMPTAPVTGGIISFHMLPVTGITSYGR